MPALVIDTDGGVDDALALLLALRAPEGELAAVTTVAGNVALPLATANVRRVLGVAGPPFPPLSEGAEAPLEREPLPATHVHGEDGLGGASRLRAADGSPRYPEAEVAVDPLPAPEALVQLGRERGPELTLVALGPLTNLARAAERDTAALRAYRRLIVMGGAFRVPGNVSPVAEYNLYADPEAARAVLESGARVTFVPLDVTHRALLPRAALAELGGPLAPFVRDVTDAYLRFHEEHRGLAGCHLHDALAVGLALWPELGRFTPLRVEVETEGALTRGMTVAEFRPRHAPPPNAEVCLEADTEAFLRRFLARLAG